MVSDYLSNVSICDFTGNAYFNKALEQLAPTSWVS